MKWFSILEKLQRAHFECSAPKTHMCRCLGILKSGQKDRIMAYRYTGRPKIQRRSSVQLNSECGEIPSRVQALRAQSDICGDLSTFRLGRKVPCREGREGIHDTGEMHQ